MSSQNVPGGRSRARLRAVAVFALALFYFALPNDRLDFTRFNSHDSESYLALAYSLSHGAGYTRSLPPADHVAHEMWPPGWPTLLTLSTVGAEQPLDWARVKWTTAALGLLGLVPVWLWVRRFADSAAADAATLVLALNPFYWHFSHQAMAELPLFLWLILGLLWVDRVWSRPHVGWRDALLTGLLSGIGMLIKGHAGALMFAPLAYLGRGGAAQPSRRRATLWAAACVAFLIPFTLWIVRNETVDAPGPDGFSQIQQIRTGDPMDPESTTRGAGESTLSILTKLRRHAIYRVPALAVPGLWPQGALDWPGSGWLALPLSILLVAAAWLRNRAATAALLAVAVLALLNLNYGYGGAARFWLPVALLLLLLVTVRAAAALRTLSPATRRLVTGGAILALTVNLGAYVLAHERAPYNPTGPWSELVEL